METIGKEAEVYGSKRCDEILRLIDEALDALGVDAPAPAAPSGVRTRRRAAARSTTSAAA